MARLGQVIGRHLRHAGQRRAFVRHRLAGARDDIARLDEGFVAVAALGHQLARQHAELVDVELVVREQHEVLEVVRAGGRIVRQPVQRIVDALRGKRRQRHRLAWQRLVGAVGDVVVGAVEVGHVEQVAKRPVDAVGHRGVDMGSFEEGEMHRNRRLGFADGHRNAVIAHQQAQLLMQVGREQIRPRDRRRVVPGRRHVPVGEAGVDLVVGRGRHADLRVEGTITAVLVLAGRQRIE